MPPVTIDLLDRAELACRLLRDAAQHRLGVQVGEPIDRDGAQAYRTIQRSGVFHITIPGTGHKAATSLGSEVLEDWSWNLRAIVPVAWHSMFPKEGASGVYKWAWGFLNRADVLFDEMQARGWFDEPFYLEGHSQGGAVAEILAWTICERARLGIEDIPLIEAHAIAPARSCFSRVEPCPKLHCWLGYDDPVVWAPPFARHVGECHWFPRMSGLLAYRHSAGGYIERIEQRRALVRGLAQVDDAARAVAVSAAELRAIAQELRP